MKLVVIFPIIRNDFINKALETLRKYTTDITIIVVDQSIEGFKGEADMVIRMKNQGFSKAANEGIIHALQWNADYICVCNDDVEFMSPDWFDGIEEEFATDPRIIAVNPECPRVPLWGYGRDHGEYAEIIPYKEEFTPEDIAYLKAGNYEDMAERVTDLPTTFPLKKRGVIDGFAMWCPVFKRGFFDKVGFFEERFIWGGGEDYSMMARAYSCAWPYDREECNPAFHWRMVSSMKSWVWHHWGQSKDAKQELDPKLFEGLTPWNDINSLWEIAPNGQKIDPWGHWTDDKGVKRPFRRKEMKVHIRPL